MKEQEVIAWTGALKAGDAVGVFSGAKLVFNTTVESVTKSGRVVCAAGGTFKPNGEIYGRLADQSRRIRPAPQKIGQ
ncbi:hypothetical protein [Pseudomonas sp. EMN2]|uniref:hypothetical protein n=1 Tax=Pseudomonas sp. EMN2 TaxID=2615212 RepID=UPI00129A5673|nr:hypothetical protein [Pseudomonas sp. EMN2]